MPDLSLYDKLKTFNDYQRANEEFQLKKQLLSVRADSAGGATITAAKQLMLADPTLDFPTAFSIAKSGIGQGNTYSGGQVQNIAGAPQAFGNIEAAKQGMGQQAEKNVDVVMNPLIAGGEANARNASDLGYAPKIKAATVRAEDKANAQIDLPKAQNNAATIQNILTDIETSPGLSASVGMPDIRKGRIPWIGDVAGSPAADFTAKLEQLKGTQFLTAYQNLRGGGQISNVEGVKAENAIARMQTSQSEVEFKKALNEFKVIVAQSADRAALRAGSAPETPSTPDPRNIPAQAVQYLKVNPHYAPQFDEMYGAGASKMVIGR